MSMLKKLKGLFIIEENGNEVAKSSQSDAKATKVSKTVQTKSTNVKESASHTAPNGDTKQKVDSKFVDVLLKAIENNNIEGFDYLEFKESLRSLAKIETDEAKRYRNAFAMAQTMGLDKKKLFDSAQHYINVLAAEEKKFSLALENRRSSQIEVRESKIAELKNAITHKEEHINKLKREIEEASKELQSIEGQVNQSLAKAESTKDGFYASYQMVLDQIQSDVDKLNRYLQ